MFSGSIESVSPLEVPMKSTFQDILSSVTEKKGRSRLEPYGDLIDEFRRRGLTCRDIVAVLAEKCQFQISKTAVNNFVRARFRRKQECTKRPTSAAKIVAPGGAKIVQVDSAQRAGEDDFQRRITALKARKKVTPPSLDDFHFDPTQPLRLITREKQGPDK
jgi:hypothetical protein